MLISIIAVAVLAAMLVASFYFRSADKCPMCEKKLHFWQRTKMMYLGPTNVGGNGRGSSIAIAMSHRWNAKVHAHH